MKKREPKAFPSKCKFAHAIGVSAPTLDKLLKLPNCPIATTPIWSEVDRDRMIQFYGSRIPDNAWEFRDAGGQVGGGAGSTIGDYHEIRNRKELARTELIEVQRKVLEGRYIERAGVEDALAGMCLNFIHAIDRLQRALPPAVEGQTAERCELIVRDHLDAMRRELLGDLDIRMVDIKELRSAVAVTGVRRQRGRPQTGQAVSVSEAGR